MSPATDTQPSPDTIFQLLSSKRRRFVLSYLTDHNGEATLDELATALAAEETDVTPANLEDKAQKRAYISLYQTHIPRMTEAGIITYDQDSGRIQLTSRADPILSYLHRGGESSARWAYLYLGTALVGLLFTILGETGTFEPVSISVVALAISFAIVLIALAHYVTEA